MTTPRTMNGGNGNPVDDGFLQDLYRGGELLAEGKVMEAREYLERAGQLQPQDEKCQNLLGLTYFKLGQFDRAASIYDALVRANPADPTLRVNLGLVFLKTNFLVRAIREFQTAINLAPDHKKAHNYLGLAFAQAGEYARARDHFLAAGSEAMAEKMSEAAGGQYGGDGSAPPLANDPAIDSLGAAEPQTAMPYDAQASGEAAAYEAQASGEAAYEAQASGQALAYEHAQPEMSGVVSEDWAAQIAEEEAMARAAPKRVETAKMGELKVGSQHPTSASVAPSALPTPALRQLAASLEPLPAPPMSGSFQVTASGLAIAVSGQMLTRLSGMVAYSGGLTFSPERKRFRDRATDRWFGEGEDMMARAAGQGVIFINLKGRIFVALHLGGEPAYFREDVLFAFESSLTFENGRLPSPFAADLDLVHLRGRGNVLLSVDGALRSVEVEMSRPVTIPLQGLSGWQGHLTPRISSVLADEEGKVQRAGLELSGEGFALFTVPLS